MSNLTPNSQWPASWPYDQEIFYHLDLVPYIDLKVQFDPRPMLAEAFALLDKFVEHRSGVQENKTSEGRWKSLGLRTFAGDPTKTEYHTSYTSDEVGLYQNTPLMDLCPETKKFLGALTDLEACDRIRFMLLEPGTEIKVHSDSARDVSFAINISLNMPDGCVFWSHLNSDGSTNEYSLKIPFSDSGSVLLFNNAKYHKLKNDSAFPRMHLIFHGPIKFNDEFILSCARTQNKVSSRKELVKLLVQKKALLGESFAKTPALLKDWINSGLREDSLGEGISLVVLKTKQDDFEKITEPSLFPLRFSVVESIDEYLKNNLNDRFVVVCAAGTFVKNTHKFVLESLKQIQKMRAENVFVSGHLMAPPEQIPYFHQQFLIIDVENWNKYGGVSFETFFGTEKIEMQAFSRGKDVHDDYTPEWIEAASGSVEGLAHWGSKVIARSLEVGAKILNLSGELRACKDYSYPLDGNTEAKNKIQTEITDMAAEAKQDVYLFNNEELAIPLLHFKPEVFLSVAAGFKPIKILQQYNFKLNSEIHFVDFSANALRYMRSIVSSEDFSSLLGQIEKFNKVLKPDQWSKNLNENLLKATLRDYFNGNEEEFFQFLKLASSAEFHEMNFVLEPDKLVSLIGKRPFLIWVSNAFYNNHIYHLLGKIEAENHYLLLAKMIAEKIGVIAFKESTSKNIIFGESLDVPVGFLTDGCTDRISKDAKDFIVI